MNETRPMEGRDDELETGSPMLDPRTKAQTTNNSLSRCLCAGACLSRVEGVSLVKVSLCEGQPTLQPAAAH
jgi:hypothetical protein